MKRSLFFLLAGLMTLTVCGAPLKRLPSTPFPEDFKAWEPKRTLDLTRAAIGKIESGNLVGVEKNVQQYLAQVWGITFPVMDTAAARAEGRPLILVGKGSANTVTRRLHASTRILPYFQEWQVRVFPELYDWKTGAVYLGGITREQIMAGAKVLTENFKDPKKLSFFIRCGGKYSKPTSQKLLDSRYQNIYDLFTDGKVWLPRTAAISVLNNLYLDYLRHGNEADLRNYSKCLKFYEDHYDALKGISLRPPTFTAHMLAWQIAGLEDNPLFSAEDRLRGARLIRRIGEETMNFWEMRTPAKSYQEGRLVYLTNHPIFASRTSYFCGEYLLHRYNYQPAKFWMAAAAHAMKGVEPHPIGPEDSPGYHHLCTNIFINYALASGNYDLSFFKKPSMQEYFRYTKAQWAQNMRTVGYGDASGLGGPGKPEILAYAVDIFDDADAKAILAMIGKRMIHPGLKARMTSYGVDLTKEYPISDFYNGLLVFPMDPFRLNHRKAPRFDRPILDKAYFRSGWESDGDFILTSGLSNSPHGHCDVNAILRYGRGRHIWLTEGHYILYSPEEHNTLSLRYNGRHCRPAPRDRGALGQVLNSAMTPSKKFAVSRVLAEGHGPVNWIRTIVWNAKHSFWVLDELAAQKPGQYLAEYRWRTLGEFKQNSPQSIHISQLPDDTSPKNFRQNIFDQKGYPGPAAPADFYIHGGDGTLEMTSQEQLSSMRHNSDYYRYNYALPVVRVITSRQQAQMKTGDVLRNAHFFTHTSGKQLRKLADNAWTADGQIVLLGKYSGNGIAFDGDALFAGPNGIIGFNVRSVRIGSFKRSFQKPQDLISEEPVQLAGLAGKELRFARPAPVRVPVLKPAKVQKFTAGTSVLAAGKTGFGVGFEDGTFRVIRRNGSTAWQDTGTGMVTAVCALQDSKGREYWVAAFDQRNVQKPAAFWRLYDSSGKKIAEQKSRYATITTIFPFRDPKNGETCFIVGSSGWMALAFDLTGKKLWQYKCYHNMISGGAADCDGDGKDEIMLGAGYYYHQMITSAGKLIFQRTNAAWNYCVAVCDIDSDGKPEFVCGRADNAVHVMTPLDKKQIPAIKPLALGGIIQTLIPYGKGFAAAVENGTVTVVDPGMKIRWSRDLPAGISGLAVKNGTLYTVCRDGFIYAVAPSGKITGKYPVPVDQNSICKPAAATGEAGTAVISGNTIVIL